MWGSIIADITFQTNFNLGFPESNSDIILNLSHWQYWWWFWFTYLLVLYYFIFLRLIQKRLLKFNPKLVTSYKARGKWGDLIICILPISWCLNILSNSNFILRMVEWQTESSLFTVRVRGRQWYWVYKMDIKFLLNVSQFVKNCGNNYWVLFNNTNMDYTNEYLNLVQLNRTHDWLLPYMKRFLHEREFKTRNHTSKGIFKNLNGLPPVEYHINLKEINIDFGYNLANISGWVNELAKFDDSNTFIINTYYNKDFYHEFTPSCFKLKDSVRLEMINTLKFSFIDIFQNDGQNREDHLYLVIKQKKFLPKKTLFFKNFESLVKFSNKLELHPKLNSNDLNPLFRKLKTNSTTISNSFNKRLLRTRRTLVLPSNINITLITNSFDVVHSWYIPGLGIKLDCVPGRSTHHTINIDHAGFYYGQCAEICGRHHHHMPIRVCALPYEHFLVWWYNYGLPRIFQHNLKLKKPIFRQFYF